MVLNSIFSRKLKQAKKERRVKQLQKLHSLSSLNPTTAVQADEILHAQSSQKKVEPTIIRPRTKMAMKKKLLDQYNKQMVSGRHQAAFITAREIGSAAKQIAATKAGERYRVALESSQRTDNPLLIVKQDRQTPLTSIQRKKVEQSLPGETILLHKFNSLNWTTYNFLLRGVQSLKQYYRKMKREGDAISSRYSMIVHFIQQAGVNRLVTISSQNNRTYEKFEEFLTKIMLGDGYGDEHGSSPLQAGSHLDPDHGQIIAFNQPLYGDIIGRAGSFTSKYYEFYPSSDDNTCFISSLLSLGVKPEQLLAFPDQDGFSFRDASNIGKLLGVRVMCDVLTKFEVKEEYVDIDNKRYNEVDITDGVPTIVFKEGHYQAVKQQKLLYASSANHLVSITEVKGKQKAVILDKRNALIFIAKQTNDQEVAPQYTLKDEQASYTEMNVYFDYETVFDISCQKLLRPFSIQFIFNKKVYVYQGFDCSDRFVEFLLENQNKDGCQQYKYVLVGFNNSRFDNILLIQSLIKFDCLSDKILIKGDSILSLRFGGNAEHSVFDICRIVSCSLKAASAGFQLKFKKANLGDEVDFFTIQQHFISTRQYNSLFHESTCDRYNEDIVVDIQYDHGDKNDVMIDRIKSQCCSCKNLISFITYGIYDVLATEELYEKVTIVGESILKNFKIDQRFHDFKTVGSLIYKIFDLSNRYTFTKETKKKTGEIVQKLVSVSIFPKMSLDEFHQVKKGQIGGRTQCYHGRIFNIANVYGRRYTMIDCVSLYPYVCLERDYPCGVIQRGSYKECKILRLIGFFKVDFTQPQVEYLPKQNPPVYKPCVYPNKVEGRTLDWNYHGRMSVVLNTVDITVLMKHGVVIHNIADGFFFSDKRKGTDIFSCVNYFKEEKMKQDVLKDSKDERYNPALRNLAKLYMNALSGKVGENFHTTQYEYVKDMSRLQELSVKYRVGEPLIQFSGNRAFVKYEKTEEEVHKKGCKPAYLSSLIYSYAREHMTNTILQYNPIYQDTDSALVSEEDYLSFVQDMPQMMGSEFGQFKHEDNAWDENLQQGLITGFVILSPKNYFLMSDKGVIKKGFKGISLTADRFMTAEMLIKSGYKLDDRFDVCIDRNWGKMDDDEEAEFWSGRFDLYNKHSDRTLFTHDKWGCVVPNQPMLDLFIKQQQNNEPSYFMVSSLQKLKGDTRDGKKGFNMYQQYIIKKIN